MNKIVCHLERKRCPRCKKVISARPPCVLAKCLYGNQLLTYVAVLHYIYLVFDHNRLITNLQRLKADSRRQIACGQKEKPVSLGGSLLFTKFRRRPPYPQRYRGRRANGWLSFLIVSTLRDPYLDAQALIPPSFPHESHTHLFLALQRLPSATTVHQDLK